MDNLSQLALKTQTIFGGVHFLFFLTSWPFVIGMLKDHRDKDLEAFHCFPGTNEFVRQRCYVSYSAALSPLLTPLDFAAMMYAILGLVWLSFILLSAMLFQRIKRGRHEQEKTRQTRMLMLAMILHACLQFILLTVLMGIFCIFQSLRFPPEYKCDHEDTRMNYAAFNITCSNLLHKEKTKLNIVIVVIMVISIVCCLLTVIHLLARRKMFLQQLIDVFTLEGESAAGTDLTAVNAYSKALKASIKSQTEFQPKLIDFGTKTRRKTDEIFINVLIQEGRKPVYQEQNFERENCLNRYAQVRGNRIQSSQEIFASNADDEENPKSILLTGKAGIGKTLFCQKLIRDWAEDTLFHTRNVGSVPDFKFVYLLTFRQLNLLGDELVTLREIINCSSVLDDQSNLDEALFQYILDHPEQVLIIMDGFDEFSRQDYVLDQHGAHQRYPNSSREKMPVSAICSKLMRGEILQRSTILISSRPDESDILSARIRFGRHFQITGFSKEEVQKYIESYFQEDETLKNTVVENVMSNENLVSFAHIPVLCALMCSYMEYTLNESADRVGGDFPVSTSDLYFEIVNIFELKHNKTEGFRHPTILDKLSEFAAQMLVENKFFFNEEDMARFSSHEVLNLKANGLFNCGPPFRVSFSQTTKHFCFTHLTLHEYLAARYFAKRREVPPKGTASVMTLQFMAGVLSTERDDKFMEQLLEELPLSLRSQNYFEEVFPGRRPVFLAKAKCLCEYKDKKFAKHVIKTDYREQYRHHKVSFDFDYVSDVDTVALSFFLDIFSELNAERANATTDALRGQMYDIKCLVIRYSKLSHSGLKRICTALERDSCAITSLRFLSGRLNDELVNCLSDLVTRKLTDLQLLANEDITDVAVKHLCEALKTKTSMITQLRLDSNHITDDGVACLCNAFTNSQVCKLSLTDNRITDAGVERLSQTLLDANCKLRELDLRHNQITDTGAVALSRALKHPNCKVTTLNLACNMISNAGTACLCKAVEHSGRQVELSLNY